MYDNNYLILGEEQKKEDMSALVFIVVFALISVEAVTFTETVELRPQTCKRSVFGNINRFSVEVYDTKNSAISVYLNKGNLTTFDEDRSLVQCENVKVCGAKNLPLGTGTYTIFICNDHHFIKQRVKYVVSYWRLKTEAATIVIVFLIFFCCIMITLSLYVVFVRKPQV